MLCGSKGFSWNNTDSVCAAEVFYSLLSWCGILLNIQCLMNLDSLAVTPTIIPLCFECLDQPNLDNKPVLACMHVCMCAFACLCVCMCVRVCACVCDLLCCEQ